MAEMALAALHGMVVDSHSASIESCGKIPNFKDKLTNWLNRFKKSKDNEVISMFYVICIQHNLM